MSKDFRPNRRPAGTPTGGQFAPTSRPEAENIELVDDEVLDELTDAVSMELSTEADEHAGRVVTLDARVLDDVVIEIEAALGDDSRDANESAFWDDDAWKQHLETLLGQTYETSSVEIEGETFRLVLGRARPGAGSAGVTEALRGLDDAPVAMSPHTNPDGSVGGLVASTATVDATAWVDPDARVLGNAHVIDSAKVLDRSVVKGDAIVAGYAVVADRACVSERACVLDHAVVCDHAAVSGDAVVCSAARVLDRAKVTDRALVSGYARIRDDSVVGDRSVVTGHADLGDFVEVRGVVRVAGEAVVSGRTVLDGERVLAGVEVA